MKKINLKKPKYILPLIIFLPLVFLAYQLTSLFNGSETEGLVTEGINMELPEAQMNKLEDKYATMSGTFDDRDAFSAVAGFGLENEQKDTLSSGYSQAELDSIAMQDAVRKQEEELAKLEESLAGARRNLNGGGTRGNTSTTSAQHEEMDEYAKEIEQIKRRNDALRSIFGTGDEKDDEEKQEEALLREAIAEQTRKAEEERKNTHVVEKVSSQNADKFNTIGAEKSVDDPLIKAMIDQTTKAYEGTRLRFRLLDDVVIQDTRLPKGTYLYGLVTGFGQQRVKASITSVLVKDKFIKINLSVYDNDGMEGFYVPESAFRTMTKDAGASAMNQNMNMTQGTNTSTITGESIALQALQSIYSSTTSAISQNIRKNKARIKYNTIVYLINTNQQ
ncbi:MAG: conjugative transposon protein TraM [Bacteroidaceae bacterium]|nr:conjugative transposon protein TraM [Prevotellaceae bacterium]MDY5630933.1 conjugative transposon protein TraM [Bacteroidaceae bacterium]